MEGEPSGETCKGMRQLGLNRGISQAQMWAQLVTNSTLIPHAAQPHKVSMRWGGWVFVPLVSPLSILCRWLSVQQGWGVATKSSHFPDRTALVLLRPVLRRRGHLGAVSSCWSWTCHPQEKGSGWRSSSIHYSGLRTCHTDSFTILQRMVQLKGQHKCLQLLEH